jgi:hypothetical protein
VPVIRIELALDQDSTRGDHHPADKHEHVTSRLLPNDVEPPNDERQCRRELSGGEKREQILTAVEPGGLHLRVARRDPVEMHRDPVVERASSCKPPDTEGDRYHQPDRARDPEANDTAGAFLAHMAQPVQHRQGEEQQVRRLDQRADTDQQTGCCARSRRESRTRDHERDCAGHHHRSPRVGLSSVMVVERCVPEQKQNDRPPHRARAGILAHDRSKADHADRQHPEVENTNAPLVATEQRLDEGKREVRGRALHVPRVAVGHPSGKDDVANPREVALIVGERPRDVHGSPQRQHHDARGPGDALRAPQSGTMRAGQLGRRWLAFDERSLAGVRGAFSRGRRGSADSCL